MRRPRIQSATPFDVREEAWGEYRMFFLRLAELRTVLPLSLGAHGAVAPPVEGPMARRIAEIPAATAAPRMSGKAARMRGRRNPKISISVEKRDHQWFAIDMSPAIRRQAAGLSHDDELSIPGCGVRGVRSWSVRGSQLICVWGNGALEYRVPPDCMRHVA